MALGYCYANILQVAGRTSVLPLSSYYGSYQGAQGPKVGHLYSLKVGHQQNTKRIEA